MSEPSPVGLGANEGPSKGLLTRPSGWILTQEDVRIARPAIQEAPGNEMIK